MIRIGKYCGLIVLLGLFSGAGAQDINFSQFYELPMLRNPALAGVHRCDVRVTAAYRNQWNSVTVPYKTTALGGEMKFGVSNGSSDHVSIGLMITNDIAGDSRLGKTQFFPGITYHKQLNNDENTFLSAGFMGGPVFQRFDPSKLAFDDQFVNGAYSPTNPTRQVFANQDYTYWDIAAGLSLRSMLAADVYYYIGAAYFHPTRPKVAFLETNDVRLNRKFVVNAGLTAYTGDFDRVTLYADYFTQGGNGQAQGGIMYRHDLLQVDEEESIAISGGAFIRWRDALVPMIKLDYYKLGIGLTYDVNISKLSVASQARGGFELTLTYLGCLNIRRSMPCPVTF
ncbi:MAG: PorP/SprF family type IX secretion system membrane protein [Chitinophagaceae bacterium]